ncbi:MAG: hypothetical protein DMF71_18445 [Acidobacteria bacterium]|nr:MAG: hypothetical protein DMF71_18445 [Acidobacteriota bacterium]
MCLPILWIILGASPLVTKSSEEDGVMKYRTSLLIVLVVLLMAVSAFSQEKGVDTQSKQIRDAGTGRTSGANGGKQDTGTSGSGINWGADKTRETVRLPNPYRLTARRDSLLKAVEDVMRDRKLILDDAASKPDEGIIISQPYTFIKGAVVTQSELYRFANVDNLNARGWTRGRYTITVEVQAIDGTSCNVSVNAKIEGRTDGPSGAEWITLQSTGTAEQEFLAALLDNLGASPAKAKP